MLVFAAATTTATAIAASPTASTAAAAKSAAATAAATESTTASTATESATAATGFGPGFIHVQRARAELVSVHRADRFFGFLIICHLHKTKAARLAGIAVFQNSDVFDLPVRCKSLPKFIFTDVKIQIAYINILHAILLCWSAGA
jgi:hypothetical protein